MLKHSRAWSVFKKWGKLPIWNLHIGVISWTKYSLFMLSGQSECKSSDWNVRQASRLVSRASDKHSVVDVIRSLSSCLPYGHEPLTTLACIIKYLARRLPLAFQSDTREMTASNCTEASRWQFSTGWPCEGQVRTFHYQRTIISSPAIELEQVSRTRSEDKVHGQIIHNHSLTEPHRSIFRIWFFGFFKICCGLI